MATKTITLKANIKIKSTKSNAKSSGNFKSSKGTTAKTVSKSSKNTTKTAAQKEKEFLTEQEGEPETLDTIVVNQYNNTTLRSATNATTKGIVSSAEEFDPENDQSVSSWDTRLSRVDAFYTTSDHDAPVISPFSSETISSTFMQMDWIKKKADAKAYYPKYADQIDKIFASTKDDLFINMSAIFGHNEYSSTDGTMLGVSSLMNAYSLTKLCGGLGDSASSNDENPNYMYDIRDHRRFYDISNSNSMDFYTVSNPTVTQLIKWGNADKWGRTPYTYQDFVYNKFFGIVPNNRLLTLRRYHAPTYDNLNFPNMFGKQDDSLKGKSSTSSEPQYYFAPRCTVVSYFGEGTDNQLSGLMSFSTGVPWEEILSKVWEVNGQAAGDHQAEMDQKFESDGFGGAEKFFGGFLHKASEDVGKIMSYGKFALALKKPTTYSEDTQHKLMDANYDPYESNGEYENRLKGPVNRIDKVYKRKAGIDFSHSMSFKVTYKAKAIGGINPKAAMLDIMSNCMEMCSVNALWWGGGHRFMVQPRLYPWHDGDWRDGFMEKLYQGEIFGDNGAIADVVKGLHNIATNNGQAKNASDVMSNLLNNLKNMLGSAMGGIGSLISSISSSLFGEGSNPLSKLGNFLTDKGDDVGGEGAAEKGKKMMGTLLGNLTTMWKSKVIAQTQLPTIRGMGSLLIGEPVGEWHLTVGNPLNPIMVIGNLIVDKCDVTFSDELGPDDFPEEMTVTYSIKHGMARDKAGIQSMFNRGMGKIYNLPDYIASTSESETKVDGYTGTAPGTVRTPGFVGYPEKLAESEKVNGFKMGRYRTYKYDKGKTMENSGNYNTQLITKFTPVSNTGGHGINTYTSRFNAQNQNRPIIRSLGITRRRD